MSDETKRVSQENEEKSEASQLQAVLAELREQLGLEAEVGLELAAAQNNTARNESWLQQLAENKFDDYVHDRSTEKVQHAHEVREYFARLSTKEKRSVVKSRLTLAVKLFLSGVKDPGKLIHFLEQSKINGFSLKPEQITNPRLSESLYEYYFLASHRAAAKPELQQFWNELLSVSTLDVAADRLHKLGGYFRSHIFEFEGEDANAVRQMVLQLCRLNQETFDRGLEIWKNYPFLFPVEHTPQEYKTESNLSLQPFIEFLSEHGAKLDTIIPALELAKQLLVAKEDWDRNRDSNRHPILSLHDPIAIYENRERLAHEVVILQQLLAERDSRSINQADSIFYLFDELQQRGLLVPLSELIQSGFVLGQDLSYKFVERFRVVGEEFFDEIAAAVQTAKKIQADTRGTTSIRNLVLDSDREHTKRKRPNNFSLSDVVSQSELYEKPDETQTVFATVMQLLQQIDSVNLEMIATVLEIHPELGLIPDANSLIIRLKELPEEKVQELPRILIKMIEWFNKSQWFARGDDMSLFMLLHHHDADRYTVQESGGFTLAFLEEFHDFFSNLPEKYFANANKAFDLYLDKYMAMLLSEDSVPAEFNEVGRLLKNLDGSYLQQVRLLFWNNLPKFCELARNDPQQVSVVLAEYSLAEGLPLSYVIKLVPTEKLEQLTGNQRILWELAHKYPEQGLEISFLFSHQSKLDSYLKNGSFTPALMRDFFSEITTYHTYYRNLMNELVDAEETANFTQPEIDFWRMVAFNSLSSEGRQYLVEHETQLIESFQDGSLTDQSLVLLAQENLIPLLEAILSVNEDWDGIELDVNTHTFRLQLSEQARQYWDVWMSLPPEGKKEFVLRLSEIGEITPELARQVELYQSLLNRINNSPSRKIRELAQPLSRELLSVDDPEMALAQIEQIFIQNNLPEMGKVFKMFQILFSADRIAEIFAESGPLSPVLERATHVRKLDIILSDLATNYIRSGNPDLYEYLQVMRVGSSACERIRSGEHLSPDEEVAVGNFLQRMKTLLSSSLLGQLSGDRIGSESLEAAVSEIYQAFRVGEGQSLENRLIQMFFRGTEYTRIQEILDEMERVKRETHARNVAFFEANKNGVQMQEGWLVKGVVDSVLDTNERILHRIAQTGINAREYTATASEPDLTPFDSDFARILSTVQDSFRETFLAMPSSSYGRLHFVIRDRGQFYSGEEVVPPRFIPGKFELINSNQVSSGAGEHVGIRTGIPFSEVDMIVVTPAILENVDGNDQLQRLFNLIAQNGFYVPVVDMDGKFIFTPEDYEQYRKPYLGLDTINTVPIAVEQALSPAFETKVETVRGDLASPDRQGAKATARKIKVEIAEVLAQHGVQVIGEGSLSLVGAGIADIGSTSRDTHMGGASDYDFAVVLSMDQFDRVDELKTILMEHFGYQDIKAAGEGPSHRQIRLEGVKLEDGQVVDLDIGLIVREEGTDPYVFEAYAARIGSLPQAEREFVVANVLLAKQLLKEAGVYKRVEEGGLGGIGVEAWILDNNGNIQTAFESFWRAANQGGSRANFSEFKQRYHLFSSGVSLREDNKYPNFIRDNLSEDGYNKMYEMIGSYRIA